MLVLEFQVDATRFAVPVERVIEVVPRVWLTPLPGAAGVVAGVFNHRGSATVAVDLRERFDHPPRRPSADDHLLVVRGARRTLALLVDRVLDLREVLASQVQAPSIALRHVAGVALLEGGLVLLQDLDAVFSLDEEDAVDRGLRELARAP